MSTPVTRQYQGSREEKRQKLLKRAFCYFFLIQFFSIPGRATCKMLEGGGMKRTHMHAKNHKIRETGNKCAQNFIFFPFSLVRPKHLLWAGDPKMFFQQLSRTCRGIELATRDESSFPPSKKRTSEYPRCKDDL